MPFALRVLNISAFSSVLPATTSWYIGRVDPVAVSEADGAQEWASVTEAVEAWKLLRADLAVEIERRD